MPSSVCCDFETVCIDKKTLRDTTVQVDSKHVYVGRDANWRFSLKKLSAVELAENGIEWTTLKGECIICTNALDQRALADLCTAMTRYIGKQHNVQPLSKPAPPRRHRRRQVYGKHQPRLKPIVSNKMEDSWPYSSDEDNDGGGGATRSTVASTKPSVPQEDDSEKKPLQKKRKRLQINRNANGSDDNSEDDEFLFTTTATPKSNLVSPAFCTEKNLLDEQETETEEEEESSQRITQFFAPKSTTTTEKKKAPSVSAATATNKPFVKKSPFFSKRPPVQRSPFFSSSQSNDDEQGTSPKQRPLTQDTAWLLERNDDDKSPRTPTPSPTTPTKECVIENNTPPSPRRTGTMSRYLAPAKRRRFLIHKRNITNRFPLQRPPTCSPPDDDVEDSKYHGLRNLGNTCYLNASVQALFSLEGFVETLQHSCNEPDKTPLASSLVSIYKQVQNKTGNPSSLKLAIDKHTDKFRGRQQRDAHEFLAELVDALQEEVPTTKQFFEMVLKVCLECDNCGYNRSKEEVYRHLSIDIVSTDNKTDTASVQEGLCKFFGKEKREIKCEKCHEGTSATQTLEIVSRPKALLLHLKRFVLVEKPRIRNEQDDEKENRPPEMTFRKNKAPVDISDKVSLDSKQYGLKSVVHHIGTTAFSGHYTADAVRGEQNEWVTFDDTRASCMKGPKNQHTAYMLLYAL